MIIKVNNFLIKSSFPEVDGVARLEVDLLLGEDLGVLLLLPGARNVAAPGVEVPSEATAGTSGSVTNFLGDSSADLENVLKLFLVLTPVQFPVKLPSEELSCAPGCIPVWGPERSPRREPNTETERFRTI